jgi:hypothetical protein
MSKGNLGITKKSIVCFFSMERQDFVYGPHCSALVNFVRNESPNKRNK